MKILHNSRKIREHEFFLVFYYEDGLSGFRFPCDHEGTVSNLPTLAFENYERCVSKDLPVSDGVLEAEDITYSLAVVGVCECSQEILLTKEYNDCPNCFRVYDQSGRALKLAI